MNLLSQFLCDPLAYHWHTALQRLHYLISTKHLCLQLGGSLEVSRFSDSYLAEDPKDHKSTAGYTYRLGTGAISWKSQKQATVSLSSTEAEYKASSDSFKEGVWLFCLLAELHLCPQAPILLHIDNSGAEALAKNPQHCS